MTNPRLKTNMLLIGLVALGLSAGVVVAGIQAERNLDSPSTGIEAPLPKTMAELVSSSDLIVVGSVGRLVNQGTFYGYDAGARKRKILDRTSLTPLGVPISDYEIDVEETLLDNGTVASHKPVILRIIENPGEGSPATPKLGERRLYFLGRNPDQATYGLRSLMHQIDLGGPVAVFRRGASELPLFGKAYTPEDVIQQTREVIRSLSQK